MKTVACFLQSYIALLLATNELPLSLVTVLWMVVQQLHLTLGARCHILAKMCLTKFWRREQLATFTMKGHYIESQDNFSAVAGEERTTASPIHDFPALEFRFVGDPPVTKLQPLIIQPQNYLGWDAKEKLLCVNILEELDDSELSLLGVDSMREHLFEFDMEYHRVRWKPSSDCKL